VYNFSYIMMKIRTALKCKRGTVLVIFALSFIPILTLVGFVLDYGLLKLERNRMQSWADSVVLKMAKEMDTIKNDAKLRKAIIRQLSQLTSGYGYDYKVIKPIKIERSKKLIALQLEGSVNPVFAKLYTSKKMDYTVLTEVQAPISSFSEIYILLDDSSSMLFAADADSQRRLRAEVKRYFNARSNWRKSQLKAANAKLRKATSSTPASAIKRWKDTVANMTNRLASEANSDHRNGCEFACHSGGLTDHVSKTPGGSKNLREIARDINAKLRINILGEAVAVALDTVGGVGENNVKLGVYYFSEDVYMWDHASTFPESSKPVKAPLTRPGSSTLTTLKTVLTAYENQRGERRTDFMKSLDTMHTFIGKGGDGSSSRKPRKLLLLVTDGVESPGGRTTSRPSHNNALYEVPLHPDWCDQFKDDDITMAVVYTGYPHIPDNDQYNNGIGRSMREILAQNPFWIASSSVPTSRRSLSGVDYIPFALQKCASPGLFLRADEKPAIQNALKKFLDEFLSSLRLTK